MTSISVFSTIPQYKGALITFFGGVPIYSLFIICKKIIIFRFNKKENTLTLNSLTSSIPFLSVVTFK